MTSQPKKCKRKWNGRNEVRYFTLPHHFTPLTLHNTEKVEDARARAAVKAQIEADRKALAEKKAMEKAIREGRLDETAPVEVPKPAVTATAAAGTAGRDFKDTRLQIRMSTGGLPYTTTLSSDARKAPPKISGTSY